MNHEQLRMIESRDAELAQLMHDEEKLKRQRNRQRSRRHDHARQVSDIGPHSHGDAVMAALWCTLFDSVMKHGACSITNINLKCCGCTEIL